MNSTRLSTRSALAGRSVWLAIAIPTLALAIAGFVAAFVDPELAGVPPVNRVLIQAGIPFRLALSIFPLPSFLTWSTTACIIFLRRSDDWMALLFSLSMGTFGATASRSLIMISRAEPAFYGVVVGLEEPTPASSAPRVAPGPVRLERGSTQVTVVRLTRGVNRVNP